MTTGFEKLMSQIAAVNENIRFWHPAMGLEGEALQEILIDGIIDGSGHIAIAEKIYERLSPAQKKSMQKEDLVRWAAGAVKALPDIQVSSTEEYLVYDLSRKTLFWIDANGVEVGQYPAVSGPYEKGALPEGVYHLEGIPRRKTAQNDPKWRSFLDQRGNAWSQTIKPDFDTDRDSLAIHPDGNVPGTEGCIGLSISDTQEFKNRLGTYLANNGGMKLLVIL